MPDVGNDGVDQTFELNTQALMLIRFNEAVFQTCKNSLIKQLMITQNYGGKVIGLAHAADICASEGGNWPADKGLAMLVFSTMVDARRWEHSTPEVRQADWLAGVDILLCPCGAPPASCAPLFQLINYQPDHGIDMPLPDPELMKDIEPLMNQCQVIPTVGTSAVRRLRGTWIVNFFIINQFPNHEKYREFGAQESVQRLRSDRNARGYSNMLTVKLQPLK